MPGVFLRKQVLLTQEQVDKLDSVARENGESFAETLRSAVDHFDPEIMVIENQELVDYANQRVVEAIGLVGGVRATVAETLKYCQQQREAAGTILPDREQDPEGFGKAVANIRASLFESKPSSAGGVDVGHLAAAMRAD